MKAIDKITSHYKKIGAIKTHVPEWDLDVFHYPVTMNVRNQVQEAVGDSGNFSIHALVVMGLDENGDKLFTLEDVQALIAASCATILDRVVVEMSVIPKTVDDMKGKSAPIKNSK
jgi:hypothetical protein